MLVIVCDYNETEDERMNSELQYDDAVINNDFI